MKANETKVQQLLEGTKQYIVPLFQRPYSWEKKHWETLWDDILDLYDDDLKTHFLGSVVTAQAQTVPEGVAKFLLIDGQQRITTILILLCALRDHSRKNGGTLSDQIQNLLLTNQYQSDSNIFKLLPTQADRQAFSNLIEHKKPLENSSGITKSYEFFLKELQGIKKLNSENLKNILVNNLYVVSMVLERDDNPHLIFESLNAKGRALTQGDLIRNYFLMRIHIDRQEAIFKKIWNPLESRLSDKITNFFRHFLMRDHNSLREDEVYFVLKEFCDRKPTEESIIEQMQTFERFSQYYEQFIHPEVCKNQYIRKKLEMLQLFDVSTCYPFLLSIFDQLSNGNLQEEDVIEALTVIENFIIRRDICNVPTNSLNKIFAPLDKQIGTATNFCEQLEEILSTKSYPQDRDFKNGLSSSRLYGTNDRQRKTKYILECLERSFGHKEMANFDTATIEHVMPQTLNNWWKEHLGEGWEAVYKTNLHTLGNLTLTGYNSELSNADFPRKKQILMESRFQLNSYFKNCENWRQEDIEQQSKFMIEKALTLWPSFGGANNLSMRLPGNVTGLKPIRVSILEQSRDVSRWIEVAQVTLKILFDTNPERVENGIEAFPSFLSKNKNSLRSPYQLIDGVFLEKNLSAQVINQFCQQVTSFFGVSPNEFKIETK